MVHVPGCPGCNPDLSRGTLCPACAALYREDRCAELREMARLLAMDRDEYDAWLDEQTEAFLADSDARLDCERRHGR